MLELITRQLFCDLQKEESFAAQKEIWEIIWFPDNH